MDMTDDKRALKVFLCHIMPVGYAHSDKDAVKALYARLKREGVDCCAWLDKEKPCGERNAVLSPSKCRTILPGADWELEIRKAAYG